MMTPKEFTDHMIVCPFHKLDIAGDVYNEYTLDLEESLNYEAILREFLDDLGFDVSDASLDELNRIYNNDTTEYMQIPHTYFLVRPELIPLLPPTAMIWKVNLLGIVEVMLTPIKRLSEKYDTAPSITMSLENPDIYIWGRVGSGMAVCDEYTFEYAYKKWMETQDESNS